MSIVTAENEAFQAIEKKYGFIPNILREMGQTSPAVLNVYLAGNEAMSKSSLNPRELHTVMLTVSQANGCHYCTKAHAAILKGTGPVQEEIDAILQGKLPKEERLRSLVSATRLILQMKGWLQREDLDRLQREGVTKAQVYEIIALIGLKTISNYINHINKTEVDPQFLG